MNCGHPAHNQFANHDASIEPIDTQRYGSLSLDPKSIVKPNAMVPQPRLAKLLPATHPVSVKLLLAGGHEYTFTVRADDA